MSTIAQSGDLKNRIIFTIFILAIYRFGTFVPLPGIDPDQLKIIRIFFLVILALVVNTIADLFRLVTLLVDLRAGIKA